MNKLTAYLRGSSYWEVTGASPDQALNRLTRGRVAFWQVERLDEFTLRMKLFQRDESAAVGLMEAAQCQGRRLSASSLTADLRRLGRRWMLLLMTALSLATVLFLSQFVLFYDVTGNETVTDEEILRALEDIGVGFCVYGPNLKPQKIKNQMLNCIPKLQWLTVTQNGCQAHVVVRERPETEPVADRKTFYNIVASRDGVITEQSILAGQAVHKPGDAVLEGELLVSGLVNLERVFHIEHARAEIYANTSHRAETVLPAQYVEKRYSGREWTAVWLIVGEKRIKIFGNSGIYDVTCDKMIKTTPLSLPSGLTFPVSLSVETVREYEAAPAQLSETAAQLLLTASVEASVQQSMTAGEILHRAYTLTLEDGLYRLQSELACREMIARSVEGRWQKEEIANDGTNR